MTPMGSIKRGENMSEEIVSVSLEALERELRNILTQVEKEKVPTIELNTANWLDDYNGVSRYEEYHGFELEKKKFSELYSIIHSLLKVAEIKIDSFSVYATVEDGITIHCWHDVYNQYGRWLGTDHSVFSLRELVDIVKEKTGLYNMETLKNAISKLLSSL